MDHGAENPVLSSMSFDFRSFWQAKPAVMAHPAHRADLTGENARGNF